MLRFWENVKYRWVAAFKSNMHQCARSSLAEAAQASMKAGGEKNLSLVDAVYADITASAGFEGIWLNRVQGQSCVGSGPSNIELEGRSERRQVGRALQYINEMAETEQVEDLVQQECLTLQSSQPPKAKRRRLKNLESKTFQTILKK